MATALPVGARLMTPRRGYRHYGIHLGGGRVVHYAGFAHGWFRHGPVQATTMADFAAGHPVWASTHEGLFTAAQIVSRAVSRIGEDRYDLWRNNCEHFCNWCAFGEHHSAQVARLERILSALAAPFSRLRTQHDGSPLLDA
ncbi:MAG: lecithin retinol acyltransferase family protein [Burkholderiaceae bacterium]